MRFSEGILDNLKTANEALARAETELGKIQEKKRAAEERLPTLREALEKASREKEGTFNRYLVDECTEKAVDDAQVKFDEARRAAERTEEVLTALAEKERALETAAHRLRERRAHAEGVVWNELADQITAQVSRELCAKIHYAFRANFRKLSSLAWEPFVLSLFARPEHEDLGIYDERLDKLFKAETGGS